MGKGCSARWLFSQNLLAIAWEERGPHLYPNLPTPALGGGGITKWWKGEATQRPVPAKWAQFPTIIFILLGAHRRSLFQIYFFPFLIINFPFFSSRLP